MGVISISLRQNECSAFRYTFKVLHFQHGIVLSKLIFNRGFIAMSPEFKMVAKTIVLG